MMLLGLIQSEFRHALAIVFYCVGFLALMILLRHSFRWRRKQRKREAAPPRPGTVSGHLLVQSIELRERFLKLSSSLLIPRDGTLSDDDISAILSRLRKLQPDRNDQ